MSQRPRKFQRISKACLFPLCSSPGRPRLSAAVRDNRSLADWTLFAGDFCNRRSIKCNKNNGPLAPCQNCADFDVPCTYDRPARRRGARRNASPAGGQSAQPGGPTPAPRDDDATRRLSGSATSTAYQSRPSNASWDGLNGTGAVVLAGPSEGASIAPWKAFATACQDTIRDLAQVYFEIVYPMYGFSVVIRAFRS